MEKNAREKLLKTFPLINDDEDKFQSETGKYNLLLSQKFAAHLLSNHEKVYDFCSKIIKWWDKNNILKEQENYRYLADLFNYISSCFYLKKYNEIPETLKKISTIKPQNILEEQLILKKSIEYKQLYLMNLGKFEEAKKYINQIETKVLNSNLDNKTKTTITSNFAIIFFFLEDFHGCIKWIDEGLKNKNVEERIHLQKFLRVLKCICYWEMDDIDQFEGFIRSTISFLKGVGEYKETLEFEIINFLKKIGNNPLNELGSLYKEFQFYIESKIKNPTKQNAHGLDEYYFWLDSKIKKKSMVNLVREKINSSQ